MEDHKITWTAATKVTVTGADQGQDPEQEQGASTTLR